MENRVDEFTAGVEATFGHLAGSSQELAGFLQAARRFYLEYIGVVEASTSNRPDEQLPFWRYLIFYSTLGLDHAAAASPSDMEEMERHRLQELAGTLSSCWPLLGVVVSHTYTAAQARAYTERLEHASTGTHGSLETQATRQLSLTDDALRSENASSSIRPSLEWHTSVTRARKSTIVEPVTPPIRYTADDLTFEPDQVPLHLPSSPGASLWDSYLGRANGRSLSQTTQLTTSSNSTYPYDILATPPIYLEHGPFSIDEEASYPASTPMGHVEIGQRSLVSDSDKPREAHHNSRPLPLPKSPVTRPQETETKLLLADRGDNTARLVPTADGTYILDVSIGGKKLIIDPQRPNEVQYHDHQGLVVTQHLIPPKIPPQ